MVHLVPKDGAGPRDTPTPTPMLRQATRLRRAIQPLWTALERCVPVNTAERIVLAVSGGPDSAALMEAFARWPRRHLVAEATVVSVDHQTSAQSRAIAQRVCGRAIALGFSAEVVTVHAFDEVNEGRLRDLRYAALTRRFGEPGAPKTALLTGHHADDVADGILLSTLGLTAATRPMLVERPLAPALTLCRPFVSLPQSTLRGALSAAGAPRPVVDAADRREQNTRARLRRTLGPALAALQPRWAETVVRRAKSRPPPDPA